MPGKEKNYLERVRLESRKGRDAIVLGKTTFQMNKSGNIASQRESSAVGKMNRSMNPVIEIRSKTLQKGKKY